MFGLGMQEILLILVVALVVIGPKRLPDIARALGKAMREFRRATDDVRQNLDIDSIDLESKPSRQQAQPPLHSTRLETKQPQPDQNKEGGSSA